MRASICLQASLVLQQKLETVRGTVHTRLLPMLPHACSKIFINFVGGCPCFAVTCIVTVTTNLFDCAYREISSLCIWINKRDCYSHSCRHGRNTAMVNMIVWFLWETSQPKKRLVTASEGNERVVNSAVNFSSICVDTGVKLHWICIAMFNCRLLLPALNICPELECVP